MYVPSRRRCSLRVRTITAFTTLPFCTCPSGAASLTAAVTMSPRPAFRPVEPPSGRIICSLRAPELSATSSMLLIITAMAISHSLCHPEARGFCGPKDPGEPRDASRSLRRNNRASGSLPYWRASLLSVLLQHDLRHQRGLAHNVFQLPALQLRKRTRLLDPHHIAYMRFVFLVVRVKLFIARHHTAVERMRLFARHL